MTGDGAYARADLYDRIYAWKDYAAETARVRGLLTAAGVEDGSRVVEAACGTGNYLVPLAKHYAVSGFDVSDAMVAIARRKLPGAGVFRADMADFSLDSPADALVCLFSSIGYLHPERDLPRAAACFHRALRPGGVLVVEAWLQPQEFIPGHMVVQTWDGTSAKPPEAMKLVRSVVRQDAEQGRLSVFDFHWLALTPAGVEHFAERHEMWTVTGDELVATFRAAGFECRWLHPGPITGRGVLLARR